MHLIDQLMDAWEKQLGAPTSDQFMAQLRKFPSAGFGAMPLSSPFDLWMQTTEMRAAQLGVGAVDVGEFRVVTSSLMHGLLA